MNSFLRLTMVLFVVCGAAAGALAFMNQLTKDKIVEQARLEKAAALKEVVPDADSFKEVIPNRVWDAVKGGEKTGSVILAVTQGYGGNIEIILGVGPDNTIGGIKILNQTETPGLGAKIVERPFLDQFLEKGPGAIALKKDDPSMGSVDAISAATISSRAVTNAVRSTLDSFAKGELK
jgi:Na+-translocating ferredoxin:NAD+ oxidoreductase subunit G